MTITNALIHSYGQLVKKGSVTIDDIPAEYRGDVVKYLRDPSTIDEPAPSPSNVIVNTLNGALTLPAITLITKPGATNSIRKSEVFRENREEFPVDVRYELIRFEQRLPFTDIPNVRVYNGQNETCLITVEGTLSNTVVGQPAIAATLRVKSLNYEDMSLMVYIELT